MQKANVHAAAFSHFCHFCHVEPSSGWVGCRRGEETAPCLAARGGEAGARAGLASAGCSADAPACGQAVGSRLARTSLDFGRGRWMRGDSERMNGKVKGLGDRNTCFICDTVERGLGLEENVRLCSLKFAYVRLMGEKCLRLRPGRERVENKDCAWGGLC